MNLRFAATLAVLPLATATACGSGDDTETGVETSDSAATGDGTETGSTTETSGDGDGDSGDGDGTTSGDGDGDGDACATGSVNSFRVSEMFIRDPHFWVDPGGGCLDVTPFIIDMLLTDAVQMDGDDPPDGLLDLSLNLNFIPLDQAATEGDFCFATAECGGDYLTPDCTLGGGQEVPAMFTNVTSGDCLAPDPAHLSSAGYSPGPNTASAPCFNVDVPTVSLDIGGILFNLADVTMAAQYDGDPATQLISGTLRGFLAESDADATILPNSLPMGIGGEPVSSLIPGGTNNCAAHSDMDDNNGTPGWWMYVDFVAVPATWN